MTRRTKIILTILGLLPLVALLAWGHIYPSSFFANQERLRNFVDGYGVWSPVALIAIQILQVIITPISHYAVGIAGGFIFGTWYGFIYNYIGRVVFPADPVRKLEILLTPGRQASSVRLSGEKSAWKFKNGVTLGTTLKQLEVLNGGPFELSGWGWDYSGAVLGWKGGRLAKLLSWDGNQQRVWMRLNPPDSRWSILTVTESETLIGDKNHDSGEPALQKLNPAVTFIEIQLAQR